jgi:hypothetical protein
MRHLEKELAEAQGYGYIKEYKNDGTSKRTQGATSRGFTLVYSFAKTITTEVQDSKQSE